MEMKAPVSTCVTFLKLFSSYLCYSRSIEVTREGCNKAKELLNILSMK